MSHPERINARPYHVETPLEAWDHSQRGRRFQDLDQRRRHGALTPLQRDTWRTLLAERRALEAEERKTRERAAANNVVRMPGGKP